MDQEREGVGFYLSLSLSYAYSYAYPFENVSVSLVILFQLEVVYKIPFKNFINGQIFSLNFNEPNYDIESGYIRF